MEAFLGTPRTLGAWEQNKASDLYRELHLCMQIDGMQSYAKSNHFNEAKMEIPRSYRGIFIGLGHF